MMPEISKRWELMKASSMETIENLLGNGVYLSTSNYICKQGNCWRNQQFHVGVSNKEVPHCLGVRTYKDI